MWTTANVIHNLTINRSSADMKLMSCIIKGIYFPKILAIDRHPIGPPPWQLPGVIHKLPTDHDDVNKWRHFPRYWPFVWGIHWSPVNSPHKGQWCGALMFSLIYAWINGWENNHEAGDLRCHRAHYVITVMSISQSFMTITKILLGSWCSGAPHLKLSIFPSRRCVSRHLAWPLHMLWHCGQRGVSMEHQGEPLHRMTYK